MIKTKFVFAVSFVAMMAVGTGHAEIAGVSYVEQQVGVATTAANNAQTSANNANTAAGNAQTSADNAQDAADAAQASADAAALSAKTANDAVALKQDKLTAAQLDAANSGITSAKVSTYDGYATTIAGKQNNMLATEITTAVSGAKDSYYPSVGLMETSIATANNDVMDSVNAKLASVSSSGTGSVVKAVAKDGTAVKATLGYIGSSDITDGSVALADLASNSVNSAKIVDSSIATADIANGAVTAAKTTGIYGFIPSGSEGASTTAAIWVE